MMRPGNSTETPPHVPVMLDRVIGLLAPRDGGIYVDGTFGAGGYTRAILSAADCLVIGIDRDPRAIADGHELEMAYAGRLTLMQGKFSDMSALAANASIEAVDGVTFDLGVSSMQIDDPRRGFSFQHDGPLDMRMESRGLSAADVVNTCLETELSDIFRLFGEERRHRAIARAIIKQREKGDFTTTGELAALIVRVLGPAANKQKIHPATRCFQALRLFVNRELEELADGLIAAETLLGAHGRLVVVSFHSLEDRIVKRFFNQRSRPSPRPSRHVPPDNAVVRASTFKDMARGGIAPDAHEIAQNPRARSARLRAGERTSAPVLAQDRAKLGVPEVKTSRVAP